MREDGAVGHRTDVPMHDGIAMRRRQGVKTGRTQVGCGKGRPSAVREAGKGEAPPVSAGSGGWQASRGQAAPPGPASTSLTPLIYCLGG